MAIRLQSASLSKPFSFISRHDEAVDTKRKGFADEWKRYRDGAPGAEPPLKDGIEPTVWELSPITGSRHRGQLQGILDEHGKTAWFIANAASGITNVTGLLDENGETVRLEFTMEDGYRCIAESQLADIPPEVLVEIGTALVTHNIPNPD